MELELDRPIEPDRHFHQGGRSFYFFDFDDNIAFLSTPSYLFHKETQEQLELTSQLYAQNSPFIGKSGVYKDYVVDYNPETGTFRNFRDKSLSILERLSGQKQAFVTDLAQALGFPDYQWKGPSWNCFYHAVHNQRPLSLITARGHHPKTMMAGIDVLVRHGHLPRKPNYLSVYPVSHPEVLKGLDEKSFSDIPKLKQIALRKSVEKAIERYGYNPYHRFGMSDDDPKNLKWIHEEMLALKRDYPEMSFFVIETHMSHFVKHEIHVDGSESSEDVSLKQLNLF